MRAAFLSILALLSFGVMAAKPSDRFNLKISYDKTYSFGVISEAQGLRSLYGSYEKPMSYTNGTALRLYPNDQFTIIEWCDICPSTLIAKGSYTYTDGILVFTYTDTYGNADKSDLPKQLTAFRGWIEEKGYTTGSEFILIRPEDIGSAKVDKEFGRYLRQSVWYPDWQSMYDKETAEK